MKVLLMSVMMTSIVALRNLTPVEGLLPVSASNEENGNMTKIFLQEPGLSSLLKITQKNIDIQTRDDLLDIVEDAATENAAAAVANGISKTKLEAEKVEIANAIKANTEEKAKLNAALAANAKAQKENEDMKAEFLLQKKTNAETRAFFEADSRRDPTGAMIKVVEGLEADNARDLQDNANEADAILETRDEINESLEKNAQELETLQTTRDANEDALTENATEKIKLDATTAALNLIREVVTKNSEKGPSSLLKITEKNIDMKTRDDLLAIVDDAAKKNAAAVVANGNSKNKLEADKVAIANSIKANTEEKAKINAALAANAEAQTENEDMKADLELDANAFAATRTFLDSTPRADPNGHMLKILEGQEATNAAAIEDNAKEAKALLETRDEINESLQYNEQELNKLRTSQNLNEAALAQNAEEKIKLESTATAINLIREAITKNSELPSSLENPTDVGSGVKKYCTSGCDLPCPSGAHGPGWKLPGGSNDGAAELRFDGVELNKEYFTVSMWVNRDDRNNDIGLFSYGEYPNHQGFMLQMRNFPHSYKGDFHIRASSSVSPGFAAYDSGAVGWTDAMVVGKWLHVAIVKDGNTEIRYYLNGKQVGTPNKNFNGSPNTMPANRHFNVGSWFESTKILKGYVSNIHVIAGPNTESAYTDTHILSLYNAESQQGCSGCRMEITPGGCSSGGQHSQFDKLDCRDLTDFDDAYCPKSKGYSFSIAECNAKCLELEECAIFQRGLHQGHQGTCWFYNNEDPNGSNGGVERGWECGVKKC